MKKKTKHKTCALSPVLIYSPRDDCYGVFDNHYSSSSQDILHLYPYICGSQMRAMFGIPLDAMNVAIRMKVSTRKPEGKSVPLYVCHPSKGGGWLEWGSSKDAADRDFYTQTSVFIGKHFKLGQTPVILYFQLVQASTQTIPTCNR